MMVYGVMWREPGYGQDLWIIERRLFEDRDSAFRFAYNIANNHWHLESFSPEDYGEYRDHIALFRDGRTLAEYHVLDFEL